jgi:hypothetical protein
VLSGPTSHALSPVIPRHSRLVRGQDRQSRAIAQQSSDQVRGRGDQVLAVVQHQQQRSRAEKLDDCLQVRPAGAIDQTQRSGQQPRYQGRVGDGRKLRQPHAAGVATLDLGRDGQRQSGLADTAAAR